MAAAQQSETAVIPELPRCYLSRQTLQEMKQLLTKGAKKYLEQRYAPTKPGTDEPQTPLDPKQAKQLRKLVKALTKSMLTGMDRHLRESPTEETDVPVAPLDEELAARVAELEKKVAEEYARCCELRSAVSALVETAAKAEAEARLVPALTEEDEKKMEEEERSRIAQTWPPLQEIERLRKMRADVERDTLELKERLLPEYQREINEFKDSLEIISQSQSEVARLLAQPADAGFDQYREVPPPPPVGRLPTLLPPDPATASAASSSSSGSLSVLPPAARPAAPSDPEFSDAASAAPQHGDEQEGEDDVLGIAASSSSSSSSSSGVGGRAPFAGRTRASARKAARPY